jgi:hypothetical protein
MMSMLMLRETEQCQALSIIKHTNYSEEVLYLDAKLNSDQRKHVMNHTD